MAETLLSMRNRILTRIGNKAGWEAAVDANINEAIRQVVQMFRPQECWADYTFSASSGTSEYAFTTIGITTNTAWAIMMVRDDTDDVEVFRGSMREYNRNKKDTSVAGNLGDPRRWTRFANSLVLYSKIPDSTTRTMRLTVLEFPAAITATTDAFPLNDEWVLPVERLATALTWADLNDMAKHQLHMQLFNETVSTREKPESVEDEAPEAQLVPYVEDFD